MNSAFSQTFSSNFYIITENSRYYESYFYHTLTYLLFPHTYLETRPLFVARGRIVVLCPLGHQNYFFGLYGHHKMMIVVIRPTIVLFTLLGQIDPIFLCQLIIRADFSVEGHKAQGQSGPPQGQAVQGGINDFIIGIFVFLTVI